MLLKLWKNLQVWVHLDTLYDVIKSGPKPEGQSISKHLNGRLEAACLSVSVSDSVGDEFLDQRVTSIKGCTYIRPEAPKLIRSDVH